MKHSQVYGLYPGHITLVTDNFPTLYIPERGAFNANLALEFAIQGLKVDVVACYTIIRRWFELMRLKQRQTWDFSTIGVTSSAFLGLGSWCPLPKRLRGWVVQHSLQRAVELHLKRLNSADGVVYVVFSDIGIGCLRCCEMLGVPMFLELPESSMNGCIQFHGIAAVRRLIQSCHGIVADSVDNRQFCIGLVPGCEEKVIYVANAADTRRFSPMDKTVVRRKLGLPENEKIVVFCGHFNERKGPLRVLEALRLAGGVKGVFLGRGPQVPEGPLVLRAAPVANSELPLWMNAGDIFVLPSLAEGLANVIVEAMACGLPLVVSDRSFNRNFLTEESAVFVDPESPKDIAKAIKMLLSDNALCMKISRNTLAESPNFSMSHRVEKIREFIQRQIAAQG